MDGQIRHDGGDGWRRLAEVFGRSEPRPAPRCGNVRCEPGWDWQVDLTDHDLWLAVAGRGHFVLNRQSYAIRPGTLFWLRPGDEGRATQDPEHPLTVIYVHFDFFRVGGGQPDPLCADMLPARHVPLRDPSRIRLLLARVVRLQQLPVVLGAVEARLLLHQAILEAYRQDAINQGAAHVHPDPRIVQILTRLRQRPAERLSLGRAAELAHLSADHFSRLFKTQTGVPFRQYVIQVRLDRAYQLLEETTLGIGDIATVLGYDDIFLFSRQFKARFGIAPSQIRAGRFQPQPETASVAGEGGG